MCFRPEIRRLRVRPRWVGNIISRRFDHKIFSTVILPLPLTQEGPMSVSDERICILLVNRIENYACPVKVLLGKLTALDITSTQTYLLSTILD